ncbi:hypothetical protein PoB_003474600 [Plakobranchus ocellatus]|uniref:Transmembrane protein 185B n=1 Tax=Plakobranchus ocellatus TaxID=259542 RepID=A0AAV4AIU2_9GAST|nr:hypothetical protein PoB_003474600 [Plakobranchus ocellatus]
MNLKNMFQDFNPSKFVVFSSLLVFCLLFSLRLDETVDWSYWFIFLPIWIWKLLVFAGAMRGTAVWFRNPQYRTETDSASQFTAMILTWAEHMVLLTFEILAVFNLETQRRGWIVAFIPLFVLSVFCIGTCVWSVKHRRSCELELFCAANILQFIFLALKLDDVISWRWVIVLIPVWVVMCIALIAVLYAVVLAIILVRSPDVLSEQRRGNVSTAMGYMFFVVPLLVFEILLVNRLDHVNDFNFSFVVIPLLISLASLMCLAFGAKGGNFWWFGIRKDFCQFVLGACPCLQEYGNISYSIQCDDQETVAEQQASSNPGEGAPSPSSSTPYISELPDFKVGKLGAGKAGGHGQLELPKVVVPVLTIDMPD